MMGRSLSEHEEEILYHLERDFQHNKKTPMTRIIGWLFLVLGALGLMVMGVAIGGGVGLLLGVGAFPVMVFGAFKAVKNYEHLA